MSGFPPKVRALIAERSGGKCEGCGVSAPLELHHRQYRSRGGKDVASNGLALCGWGNHTGCHGIAHTGEGERRGWSLRSGFVPAHKKAELHDRGFVLLDDNGGVTPQEVPF